MNPAGYLPNAAPPSLSLPFQFGNTSQHSRACPAYPACPERSPAPNGAGRSRGEHVRGELAGWFTNHANSNRYGVQTGFAVTPTKQTAVLLSNRYDGEGGWGSINGVSHRPAQYNSNGYTVKTGIAVTPRKQTTVVLSNGYRKPSPGEGTNLQPLGLFAHASLPPCVPASVARDCYSTHPESRIPGNRMKTRDIIFSNRNTSAPLQRKSRRDASATTAKREARGNSRSLALDRFGMTGGRGEPRVPLSTPNFQLSTRALPQAYNAGKD
jgi:hypothetical protein